MTCKNCIHFEVCNLDENTGEQVEDDGIYTDGVEKECPMFKNSSRYIELTDDLILAVTAMMYWCCKEGNPGRIYFVNNERLGNRRIHLNEAVRMWDCLLVDVARLDCCEKIQEKGKVTSNETETNRNHPQTQQECNHV